MNIFYILNICGIVAFAVSGSLKALNHKLDILGVIILGIITAIGGGFIRDVTFDITPDIFNDPISVIFAIAVSLLTFSVGRHVHHRKTPIAYFDGAGLAIFCALGAEVALQNGHTTLIPIVFASVITGTGGGVLRDILVRETPVILNKDVYATLCISGAILSYVLQSYSKFTVSARVYTVILFVFLARIVVISLKLRLPKGTL